MENIIIIEIHNSADGLNNRLQTSEEIISKLEYKSEKLIQNKVQRHKEIEI